MSRLITDQSRAVHVLLSVENLILQQEVDPKV